MESKSLMQQYAEMKLTETMSFIAEKRRDRLSAARVTWNKLAKDKPLTAAVATQVLMANQDCVAFLPKEKLSEEICEAVLEMSPLSISFIPEEMRTEQMSYTALNAYKSMRRRIGQVEFGKSSKSCLPVCRPRISACLRQSRLRFLAYKWHLPVAFSVFANIERTAS